METDLIPEMPVDFSSMATEATTEVGTVLGAVVGVSILVALCWMGVRALRRSFN